LSTAWSSEQPLTPVQDLLLQVFFAETIAAGGLSVTKVVPEMLRAGHAFTGAIHDVDDLERHFGGLARAEDVAILHSVELGGAWPR
jgi:hypothetical protein